MKREGEPISDEKALYPDNSATDAHNDNIAVMLELVQRNQELKERVHELETIKAAAIGIDDYLSVYILSEDWDDVWLEVPSRKAFRLLREALKGE